MELMNYDFVGAVYSVCFGAVISLWYDICGVWVQETARISLIKDCNLARIVLAPILALPLIIILLVLSLMFNLHFFILWAMLGVIPVSLAFNREGALQKMQPLLRRYRKYLYNKYVQDNNVINFLTCEVSKENFYQWVSKGFLLDNGEYLYKDAQGFHEDLQKFLDRQKELKLAEWKIEVLRECGYQLTEKIIPISE